MKVQFCKMKYKIKTLLDWSSKINILVLELKFHVFCRPNLEDKKNSNQKYAIAKQILKDNAKQGENNT